MLTIYERGQRGYEDTLASLSRRGDEDLARVEPDVRAILDAVRERGDEAVLEYTERFDRRRPQSLVLSREAWLEGARAVDPAIREALQAAADRIRRGRHVDQLHRPAQRFTLRLSGREPR